MPFFLFVFGLDCTHFFYFSVLLRSYPSLKTVRSIDPASDLFSLGATAFHLLTGVHPDGLWTEHGYSWTANWQKHLKNPIDKGLELILSKLLAKDIQQRYQSAEEVLIDFQRQSTPNFIQTLKTFDFDTVTVDVRGNITSRQRRQAQFFRENLGGGAILDMVGVPGGCFVMGSPSTEAGRSNNEGPQRTVNISPFFMGKYPITQEQWEVVMGNNPSHIKGFKRPVEQVSWNNALQFCQKISQKTGKIYRLPSEAEWEYACRAGTTTPFYFGETITPDLVNYDGNHPYGSAPKGLYRKQTTDVGSFGRIRLVCMICTGLFGNGAAINGTIIIVAHRLTEVLGKLEQIITECCVVVPGTAIRSIAVVPIVAGIGRLCPSQQAPRFSRGGSFGFFLVLVSA